MPESKITMTGATSDDDTCNSESSSLGELAPQPDDAVRTHHETTIDLSRDDDLRNSVGEPQLEALVASSTPRAYQLEMLEESLRRNIIVAVRRLLRDVDSFYLSLTCSRWTPAAARPISSALSVSLLLCLLLNSMTLFLYKVFCFVIALPLFPTRQQLSFS